MPEPLNVLWICTDQQRYDTIAALGNPHIRTPHLDALAGSGVAFERAYCQSTVCAPSRASFLTGRYPRTTGCRQNGQAIPARERLISRILADQGYQCGLVGKLHLASCANGRVEARIDDGYAAFDWSHHPQPDWPENAYSQWLAARGTCWEELYQATDSGTPYVQHGVPAEFHQTTWCAERTVAFIEAHSDSPWLFSFNCFDPHHPFDPPPEYLRRYDPASLPLPQAAPGEWESKSPYQVLDHQWAHNEPGGFDVAGMTDDDHRRVKAAYYAMVELIDDQVGRILEALERTGQRERTLVIFMSDHGELLGDHGLYYKGPHFYEASVRVPLIMSLPDTVAAGARVEGLVELVDLVPTILDLAGLEHPPGLQGRSLAELCQGRGTPGHHRDHVYCEYLNAWSHPHSYGTMLRTERHKIVVYHGIEQGELYELENDPHEFRNLWDAPRAADLKLQLLKQAFDASVFTMDPLPPRLGPF